MQPLGNLSPQPALLAAGDSALTLARVTRAWRRLSASIGSSLELNGEALDAD